MTHYLLHQRGAGKQFWCTCHLLFATFSLLLLSILSQAQTITGTIFRDLDNNGVFEPARLESGIQSVTVELRNSSGNPLTPSVSTITDANGTFTLNAPSNGTYTIFIPSSNFGSGQPLVNAGTGSGGSNTGWKSSTYQQAPNTMATPDPDNSTTDNDDNGIDNLNPSANGVISHAFTLNANRSDIDFGFYNMNLVALREECAVPQGSISGRNNRTYFSYTNQLGFPVQVAGTGITATGGTIVKQSADITISGGTLTFPFPAPDFILFAANTTPGSEANNLRPHQPAWWAANGAIIAEANNPGDPYPSAITISGARTYTNPYGNQGNGRTETISQESANTVQHCSHHVFFEVEFQDVNGTPLDPSALDLTNFKVTADPLYTNTNADILTWNAADKRLTTNYSNDGIPQAGAGNSDGLWVPLGTKYTLKVEGLPAGFNVVAGGNKIGDPLTEFESKALVQDNNSILDENVDYNIHQYYPFYAYSNPATNSPLKFYTPNVKSGSRNSYKYTLHPIVLKETCETLTIVNGSTNQSQITFLGVKNDFPSAGRSTWFYTIKDLNPPAISHVTFDLACHTIPGGTSGVGTWSGTFASPTLNAGAGAPSIGEDGSTGVTGVKFNNGFMDGETRNYYFTVNGNYPISSMVQFVAKEGSQNNFINICGPSCTQGSPRDFGDLPDNNNTTSTGNYQTLFANGGPSHIITNNLRLGALLDANNNGLPTTLATGDDADNQDDEDGIPTFPTFVAGQSATITVNLANTTGGTAKLYGFIDWNNDGDFADTGEAPAAVTVNNNATSAMITFNVPFGATTGVNVGARFRLTTNDLGTGGAASGGAATDGEVEDYVVTVQADDIDCEDALMWMKMYSLIAFGDLNQMTDGEGSIFVGGDFNLAGSPAIATKLNTTNFGTDVTKKSFEVAGGIIGGNAIQINSYSAAFSSPVTGSGSNWFVKDKNNNNRQVLLNGTLSTRSVMQDVTLPAKAAKIEADLKFASTQLCATASTTNYTYNSASQNKSLAINSNAPVVLNLTATEGAALFAANTSFTISTPNNAGHTAPIIINIKGNTYNNVPNSFNMSNIPSDLLDNIIWNFCEATNIKIPNVVKGSLLAPFADVELGTNNIDGVLVARNVKIASESHLPFVSVDFSTLCTPVTPCDLNLTSLSISNCVSNNYTFSFGASWTNAPTTGNFEVFINDNMTPQTITRTNFGVSGSQTLNVIVPCITTVYKITVRFKDSNGCSYTAVFPNNPVDPLGYIYCSSTGELVTGSKITVKPPTGGEAVIFSDGINGKYDFFTNGVVGVYEIMYMPPSGYTFDNTRPAGDRAGDTDDVLDPMPGSQDNIPGINPLILGSDDMNNDGFLDDPSKNANPYFFKIIIVNGTPAVMNNNFPMNCPVPVVEECVDLPMFVDSRTATRSAAGNNITIAVPPGNVDDLLLAIIAVDGSNVTVNTPTGWEPVNQGSNGNSNNNNGGTTLAVFRRIADGTEPVSYQFTLANSASREMAGTILRYKGVDITTPINANNQGNGENDNPTAPSINTTVANTLILRLFAADGNDANSTISSPGSHTSRVGLESSNNATGVLLGVAERNALLANANSSSNTGVFTISDYERWRAMTIAIRPNTSSPSYTTLTLKGGSCTQGMFNDDATATLSGITNAKRAGISLGATYTGANFAGATIINGGSITFTGLKHATKYTVRIYKNEVCYIDVTFSTPSIPCAPAICVTGGETFLIDFDKDDEGNPLQAGNGTLGSGITIGTGQVQPYDGFGITFASGMSGKPLTLYNSEPPTGDDSDLERNFKNDGLWESGNIQNEKLLNLLIINQNTTVDNPSDNATGGILLTMSTMPLTSFSFDIVDFGDNPIQDANDFIRFEHVVNNTVIESKTVPFSAFTNPASPFFVPGIVWGERSANRITGITAEKLGMALFNRITFQTDDSFGFGTICLKKIRTDFGDFLLEPPLSEWPLAVAILGPDANNDGKPESNPANPTKFAVWAGEIVDAENTQQESGNALGDDNLFTSNATGSKDDEDGLELPSPPGGLIRGQQYTFNLTTNSNDPNPITRYYKLFFDWDNNGTFEDEQSGNLTATGKVTTPLIIQIPFTAVSDYKVRLIVSSEPINNFPLFGVGGGVFINAEVEDYIAQTVTPIELLSFTATAVDAKVLLKWSTATEKDNAFFSVQRSKDGIKWQEIEQKKGAGNSTQVLNYFTWDNAPLPGTSYYRLQQFDFDGASSFSPVEAVNFEGQKQLATKLYPNPGSDIFYLQITGDSEQTYHITVFNSLGERMQTLVSNSRESNYTIEAQQYPAGMYLVRISDAQGRVIDTIQMIKK